MDTTHVNEPVLHVVPTRDVVMRRAVCQDCGAHAAVPAAAKSTTQTCSVCASARLHLLHEDIAPPRRWAS